MCFPHSLAPSPVRVAVVHRAGSVASMHAFSLQASSSVLLLLFLALRSFRFLFPCCFVGCMQGGRGGGREGSRKRGSKRKIHPLVFIWPWLCGLINRGTSTRRPRVSLFPASEWVRHAAVKSGVEEAFVSCTKIKVHAISALNEHAHC